MSDASCIVVGVEDMATAGIVAVEAAHIAMELSTSTVVLLHVLDPHQVMGAVVATTGYCIPTGETLDDAESVLALAEAALRAEFAAINRPAPALVHEVSEGSVAAAIGAAVQKYGAARLVLGARRPHAFGRLAHPDVRAQMEGHTPLPCHLHVASLQANPEVSHTRP